MQKCFVHYTLLNLIDLPFPLTCGKPYTCSLWPDMVTKISEQLLHDNGPAYSYPDMELFHWHWKKVKVWRALRHGPLVIPPVFSITIHSFMYWRNNPFLTCPPVSKDSLDLGTFYPEQEIWPFFLCFSIHWDIEVYKSKVKLHPSLYLPLLLMVRCPWPRGLFS